MATPNPIKTHAAHFKPLSNDAPLPRPRSKSSFPPLPQDRDAYCRVPQILEYSGMGRSKLYALIAEGKLPRPIKAGRTSVWKVGKIRDALENLFKEGA